MDCPLANPRASAFGLKFIDDIAARTAFAFSGSTVDSPLMTRDTVLFETRAAFAMSWIVTGFFIFRISCRGSDQ
jgi:hypothetical protein